MAKILLDTSIIIDHIRQADKSKTAQFKLEKSQHKLFISIITHTESYSGKSVWEQEEAREFLIKLLSGLQILLYNEEISRKDGKLRAN